MYIYIVGRITRLARPSVRSTRVLTRKQKRLEKRYDTIR